MGAKRLSFGLLGFSLKAFWSEIELLPYLRVFSGLGWSDFPKTKVVLPLLSLTGGESGFEKPLNAKNFLSTISLVSSASF